jgi:diaminopimelate decarboxylase
MTWIKAVDSRSEWKHDYTIAIGLHYRANPKAVDQAKEKFDTFLKLVEEISDHYEDTRPTVADCVLMTVEFGGGTGLPYAHEVIETQNQFTSVIHLTFRKYR